MANLADKVKRYSRNLLLPALAAASLSSCDAILGPKNKNEAPETILINQSKTDRIVKDGENYVGVSFRLRGMDEDGIIEDIEYKIDSENWTSGWNNAIRVPESPVREVKWHLLENRDYTLTAIAVDNDGERDKTPLVENFNTYWENRLPETELVPEILNNGSEISIRFRGFDDGIVVRYEVALEGPKSQNWINSSLAENILMGLPDGNYTFKIKAIDDNNEEDPTPAEYQFYKDRGFFHEGHRNTLPQESAELQLITEPIEILSDNTRVFRGATNEEGLVSFYYDSMNKTVGAVDAITEEPLENINISLINDSRTNSSVITFVDPSGNYLSNIEYLLPSSGKLTGSKIFTSMNPASQAPFAIKQPERIPEYLDESEYNFLGTFTLSEVEQVYKDQDYFARNASVIELRSKNSSFPSLVFLGQANKARNIFLEYSEDVTRRIGDLFGGTMDPDAMYWDIYEVKVLSIPIVTKELNESGLCTVKGTITDGHRNPLRDVSVNIGETQTATNQDGDYMLTHIPKGNCNVKFERGGFETVSLDTFISPAINPDFIATRINRVLRSEEHSSGNFRNKISFGDVSNGTNSSIISLFDIQTSEITSLTERESGMWNTYPSWANTSQGIAYTRSGVGSENRTSINFLNLENREMKELVGFDNGEIYGISFSHDDRFLVFCYVLDNNSDLFMVNLTNGRLERLTNTSERHELHPYASPVDDRILFSDGEDIFVTDLTSASPRNLTRSSEYRENSPSWSPDGSRIAYTKINKKNVFGTYCTSNEEGEEENCFNGLFTSGLGFSRLTWSPDGSRVAVSGMLSDDTINQKNIIILNRDGSSPERIISRAYDPIQNPTWSPY